MGREPIGYSLILQALSQHLGDAFRCDLLIVEYPFKLQLFQSVLYIICRTDCGEDLMQHATRLDIVQSFCFVTLICLDKGLTAVTLTEIHPTLHKMEIYIHRLRRL